MYKTPDLNQIFIQYTHINDDCDYETRRYDIVEKGALTYSKFIKYLRSLLDN